MLASFIRSHKGLLLKTLWPRNLSNVGKVTGISAAVADVLNFITNQVIPPYFLLLISVVVFIFFCRRLWIEIHKEELPVTNEKIDFYYDNQGENTRLILQVMIGFMIIWVSYVTVGTESISERILTKLNVIEGKVDVVRDKVVNIEKLLLAGRVINNPETAEEYIVNVRLTEHQDPRKAWETLAEFYELFGVGKMDSAQIFLRLGTQFIGRKKTRALMLEHFDKHNDPALLYHFNFSMRDPEERREAFKEMRELFPDYAPSYLEQEGLRGGTKWWYDNTFTEEEKYQRYVEDGKVIQLFIEKTDDLPTSTYFYAYPPNWESLGVNLEVLSSISIKDSKQKLDLKTTQIDKENARLLKIKTDEKERLEELDVKPEILKWTFSKGQGQWVMKDGVSSLVMDGTGDYLGLTFKSAPREFRYAINYRYQFEGREQVEDKKVPRLYEAVPASGIYTLSWQDRDGMWHGPFSYHYDTTQTK